MSKQKTIEQRGKVLYEQAIRFKESGLSWMDLQNALYGPGCLYGELFPTRQERQAFAQTAWHAKLRDLLRALPKPEDDEMPEGGPSGKILVRMPKSLHAALQREAEAESVSINQLIVSKLAIQLRVAADAC